MATTQEHDVLPDHTAAEIAAIRAGIEADAEHIRNCGFPHPVIKATLPDRDFVIDGRKRIALCVELGIRWDRNLEVYGNLSEAECWAMRVAINTNRRSTPPTKKQRHEHVAIFLKAGRSVRAVEQLTGVAKSTVNDIKARLSGSGQLPKIEATVGTDGVRRKVGDRPTVAMMRDNSKVGAFRRAMNTLGPDAPSGPRSPILLERMATQKKRAEKVAKLPECHIDNVYCFDFRQMQIPLGSLDLILTDPPWAFKHKIDWEDFARLACQWIKAHGVIAILMGDKAIGPMVTAFGKHLYWQRPIHVIYANRPQPEPDGTNSRASLIGLFTRPEDKDHTFVRLDDVIHSHGPEKDLHPWQASLDVMENVIEQLTKPGELVADLFGCGSGTTLVAAHHFQRRWIGCDIDPEAYRITCNRLRQEGVMVRANSKGA